MWTKPPCRLGDNRRLTNPKFARPRDGLRAIADAQLLQNVVYMPLGCADGDHEFFCDLVVGLAGDDQVEDAPLLLAEGIGQMSEGREARGEGATANGEL